jgi:phospholipid/cholesterol/gamma-HCH transport system substrate-binding protein
MSKSRMEWKVGVFVLIGLVLAAALVIQFNKSAGPLTPVYRVRMQAKDVSGVIPGSFVLMAGVRIGSVERIELNSAEGDVTMIAKLLKKYEVRKDAQFIIRQSGFLGDQYIGVFQGKTNTLLTDGDIVTCEEPFDLGEVARSTGGLVKRVDTMVGQLSNAVARVDTTLLAGETLTNLAQTVANFRGVSERTLTALTKVEQLIDTNTPTLNASLSNVQTFSVELRNVATDLRAVIATNKEQLSASMENIKSATAKLDTAMTDVNAGKGTVGMLLKNEQMAADMSTIVSNLSVLSSNINNKGLWGVIRKPKLPAKK